MSQEHMCLALFLELVSNIIFQQKSPDTVIASPEIKLKIMLVY
jgi:hypothetical protein